MIAFFKKPYTVKRYGSQKNVDGYATAGYADIENILLDVQEISDTSTNEPSGSRNSKRICSFGQFKFTAAEYPKTKGDKIKYNDKWYECVSCVERDNTLVHHFYAEFVLCPDRGEEE